MLESQIIILYINSNVITQYYVFFKCICLNYMYFPESLQPSLHMTWALSIKEQSNEDYWISVILKRMDKKSSKFLTKIQNEDFHYFSKGYFRPKNI